MTAPQLNRVLVLEALQVTPDGAGGQVGTWAVLGTLWAEISARAGRDRLEAGMPLSRVEYRITVRNAEAGSPQRPLPGQRLRDSARVFTIRAVAERGTDGRFLTCFADEEVAA